MGWTYVESAYSHTASGNTITPAESIDVDEGDLIVIQAGTNHDTVYSDDAYDDASNSYTHRDLVDGNQEFIMTSYAIAATGGATSFTAHFTASSGYWGWVMIAVFRPDSGDTVSFDVGGTKIVTWASGTQTTSTADTTGTDEVIIAGVFECNSVGFSNHEIPSGTAATVLTMSTWNNMFYRIVTATIDDCCAEVDLGGTTAAIMEFVAFKATASGTSLAGSITGVSNLTNFIPYVYHTLINDVVTGQSNIPTVLPYTYHTLINDRVEGQSNVPTVLPYVYHTLINNVVTGLSNIPTILPYVYHTLINSVVTGLSNVPTLLPYIYHTLVNSVVSGVSTLYGNLAIIGAQVYQNLAGFVSGLSVVPDVLPYIYHGFINNVSSGVSSLIGNLSILGSGLVDRFRVYMRIGGGKF